MKGARLEGVRLGCNTLTATDSGAPDQQPDIVKRDFSAPRPNQLWVADITYVRIPIVFCYTAFITDVCTRLIVGWAVAGSLHTEALPLKSLEHALLSTRAEASSSRSVHHSDRGSKYVSLAYSGALITGGVKASVGTVGDGYDNALAETVNGLYKAELIHRQRTWPTVTAVKIANPDWVNWRNTKPLHEALGYRTPVEVEASYTCPTTTAPASV